MKLLQLARCLFGVHQRSRGRAWHDGSIVRSHCTGCGKPMRKDNQGWHLDEAAPEAQAASE
jgi:hypothetical protein